MYWIVSICYYLGKAIILGYNGFILLVGYFGMGEVLYVGNCGNFCVFCGTVDGVEFDGLHGICGDCGPVSLC